MLVVLVNVHVKPDCIEQFKAASLDNAVNSVREPGIARFDLIRQQDDPTRFILVEAYRNPDAPAAHKQTPHYLRWKDAVEPLLAEPRFSVKYESVFLPDLPA
jgi:quinol monooxygenase YgiN